MKSRQNLLLCTAALALTFAGCKSEPVEISSPEPSKAVAAAVAADRYAPAEPAGSKIDYKTISAEEALAAAPDIDIPYETFTLDNGLRVAVHEDRKAPVVAVSVWYNVGSKDEKPGKTGFAHLFEHLMFNGSENYNDEYFGPFERAGATGMNGTTWFDRTNYFQTVPTPALDMALWMESDRMTHFEGAITQERLDEQRGVVQNEKRQGDNQPYGKSEYRVLEGLFPEGHPYRWSTIGSMEDLNAASLEDVKEWFKSYYGATNTVIVLAGDIDVATAKEKMQLYFGDAPAGDPLFQKKSWVPDRTSTVHEVMYDRVPQARLDRYWAVPGRITQDNAVLSLAAQILGSGKTSRLYKELVHEREIATNVSAYVEEHNLASTFSVRVTVKPGGDVAEVDRVMRAVMADFLETGPTAKELSNYKTRINASSIRGLEQIGGFSGKAVALAEGLLYAGDAGFWKKQLGWINAADSTLVKATMNKWLSDGAYELDILPFGDPKSATEGADRSKLPDIGDSPALVFPEIQETTLSNGMKVVLAERSSVPVVNVALQFDAGYAADTADTLGVSSFAMSAMDDGTTSLSALEISEQLSSLGATLSTGAGLDTSTIRMSALKSNLGASLDIMADVTKNPAFDADEVERLRKRWLAAIEREKSQPVQLALRLLPPLMYGDGHAYGIPFTGSGTDKSTNAITPDALKSYHTNYIRPDNATLYVVGDTTLDEIKPKLEARFGNWTAPESDKPAKKLAEVPLTSKTRVIIIDKPDSPQTMILGGHLIPPKGAENNLAIESAIDALGGQFSARINMNLREDKGWAYGAYTFTQNARGQRPFLVYAPVQTDKTKESLLELQKELKAYIGAKPTTQDELEKSRENAVRSLPGSFETAGSVLSSMMSNASYGKAYDYAVSLKERYDALDVNAVRTAAKETIKPGAITWVIIGDRKSIEGPVASLKWADVEFLDADGNPVE